MDLHCGLGREANARCAGMSGHKRDGEAIVAIVVAVEKRSACGSYHSFKNPRHRGASSPVWERSADRYRYQGAGRKAWSLYGQRGC